MFSQEQEAAFQKEMDGITTEVQEEKKAETSNADDAETSHETTEVENDDLGTVENSDEGTKENEADTDGSKPESEDDSLEDVPADEEALDDEELDDEDSEEPAVTDKKAQSKEVRKSIVRLKRQQQAELAERDARIARLEASLKQNSNTTTTPNQNTTPTLDLEAQRKKRIDDMVAEGFTPEFAAQTVVYEEKQAAKRAQDEAQNQALDAKKKLETAIANAQSKIVNAANADPELKKLGENYRGPTITQPMQMALGQLERPGRTLKHILKNDPKLIERLSLRSPEEQYAQILILGGKLDAQREFQKQNKPNSKPKSPPPGKVGSRGQRSEGDDPMKWSNSKLHKEMGLS